MTLQTSIKKYVLALYFVRIISPITYLVGPLALNEVVIKSRPDSEKSSPFPKMRIAGPHQTAGLLMVCYFSNPFECPYAA